jgi:ABC-type bacteriocin/lantibiotic exporter with double-glycine peptidase domain
VLIPARAHLIALLAAMATGAANESQEVWRTANRCGANAVFIALRLNDVDANYERVMQRLPINERGTTLREMRDGLASFGLDAQVVRATPDSLQHCPLPVIAHFEEQKEAGGHYRVIIQVRPDGVLAIDGTSANTGWIDIKEFREHWTGYLLIMERRPWWRPLIPVAVVLGLAPLVLGLCFPRRRRWWRSAERGR